LSAESRTRAKRLSARARVLARSFVDADRVDRRLPARWHALLTGGYRFRTAARGPGIV
jgi:hypothetical protein